MSPAVGIGLFVAFIIGLHVLQMLGGLLRAIADAAEKENARRQREVQVRAAEAEGRARQRAGARRPLVARAVPAPERRRLSERTFGEGDEEDHGGRLDAHHLAHLAGGLDERHLRTGLGAEVRPAARPVPDADDGDALAVPSYSTAPKALAADPLAARAGARGLAKLEGLPLAARAIALSEVFGPPRGRIRPKLLGVRAVDG